ncbi:hypothetical protein E4T56_gene18974 [Termitomyces sp. T112]|nr:hypothetical protein E4T56_gene18974 [Termitomyces sp. T112]
MATAILVSITESEERSTLWHARLRSSNSLQFPKIYLTSVFCCMIKALSRPGVMTHDSKESLVLETPSPSDIGELRSPNHFIGIALF